MSKDLGQQVLERIGRVWEVEQDRVVPTESGFDWWPGSFRVAVKTFPCPPNYEGEPDPAWRVVVRTDVLGGVAVESPEVCARIGQIAARCTPYAVVYAPAELNTEYPGVADGAIWFQTTAYLRPDMAGWLPEFIARMALLQAIDAQAFGHTLVEDLGGFLNESAPTPNGGRDFRDSILGVREAYVQPEGRKANRWIGCPEFAHFAETYGRDDNAFGNGDASGLALELPFGSETGLIRLVTNHADNDLGNGLKAQLLLPFPREHATLHSECAWFNYFEAVTWTSFPQFGSWAPALHGKSMYPTHSFFVPNIFYDKGLASNAALWSVGRMSWIKKQFFPELTDAPLLETLKARYAQVGIPLPGRGT